MVAYTTHNLRQTPQSQPIPRREAEMVQNAAGGYAFPLDDWKRLDRFLILGNAGGTYYAKEQELTRENAACVDRCMAADPERTVARIVEISTSGRAPSNDPALFAFALCNQLERLSEIARTGTDILHFAAYAEQVRGWGRSLKRAVSNWYQTKEPDHLAYQVAKYPSRDGWSHRDLLRLTKPVPRTPEHDAIYQWVTKGELSENVPALLTAVNIARLEPGPTPHDIIRWGLTREMVPTEWLNDPAVWEALLHSGHHGMPLGALVRNLGKMTSVGLLAPMGDAVADVVKRLVDPNQIRRARLHPIKILLALMTYRQGHGVMGKLSWIPVPQVIDALEEAFYLAFDAVEPTGLRHLIALDVSGSMRQTLVQTDRRGRPHGLPLTACGAAAAMGMTFARTEPNYHIVGFDNAIYPDVSISARSRLDDAVREIENLSQGGTDCSLPMRYALEYKIPIDVFVLVSDGESWYGHEHTIQALQAYREKMGIPAKLAVLALTATGTSLGDPNDSRTLDVVGFDTAMPELVRDFAMEE